MNYIVKYGETVIGNIKENTYIPDTDGIKKCEKEVFSFLKEEIKDVTQINFFVSRIKNCKRFDDLSISYSTDKYSLIEQDVK